MLIFVDIATIIINTITAAGTANFLCNGPFPWANDQMDLSTWASVCNKSVIITKYLSQKNTSAKQKMTQLKIG